MFRHRSGRIRHRVLWQAQQIRALPYGEKVRDKLAEIVDDIATKVWGKAKFVDDTKGSGKSLDDFGDVPKELESIAKKAKEFDNFDDAYEFFRNAKVEEVFWQDSMTVSKKFTDFIDPDMEKWTKTAFRDFYNLVKNNQANKNTGISRKVDDFAGNQLIKQEAELQKAIKTLKKDELIEKLAKIEDENFRKILIEQVLNNK